LTVVSLFLIIGLSQSCARNHHTELAVPAGWQRIEADGLFTFYLPEGMRLVSDEMCEECAWGSTYSDDRLRLYAEYTSWNEEFAPQYLAKQADYVKEMTVIDGKLAKIQRWLLEQPIDDYKFTLDARIYDAKDFQLVARMSADYKEPGNLETVKRIVQTIQFH
jgi:hypothetical protein